jgi:hypothetical protein
VTGSVGNKWAERLESCSAEGRYDHLRQLIEGFCRAVVKGELFYRLLRRWLSQVYRRRGRSAIRPYLVQQLLFR